LAPVPAIGVIPHLVVALRRFSGLLTWTNSRRATLVRQKVTQALEPMIRDQIAHAIGIGHLYTRDKNGTYTKIEDEARVDELLATGEAEKDYWIFTKDRPCKRSPISRTGPSANPPNR
jgi:hypothetical protein